MLTTIRFSNFEATCVAYIRDSGRAVVFLEMLGSHSATNAIWAKLSGSERNNKKYDTYVGEVKIGDEGISLAQGIHYKTFRRAQPSGLVNLVMAHPCLSGNAHLDPYYVLSKGDEHPSSFWSKLNQAVKLPFKREWEMALWKHGTEGLVAPCTRLAWNSQTGKQEPQTTNEHQKVINPLDTRFGDLFAYEIDNSEEVWLAIIQKLRLEE